MFGENGNGSYMNEMPHILFLIIFFINTVH